MTEIIIFQRCVIFFCHENQEIGIKCDKNQYFSIVCEVFDHQNQEIKKFRVMVGVMTWALLLLLLFTVVSVATNPQGRGGNMLMDNSSISVMHILLPHNMIIKILTNTRDHILSSMGVIEGSRSFNYLSSSSSILLLLENKVIDPTNQVLIICGKGVESSYLVANDDAHVEDVPWPLIMLLWSSMRFFFHS